MITIHQRYRRTDGQTTCDRNTALCTKVHRAVKTTLTTSQILNLTALSAKTSWMFGFCHLDDVITRQHKQINNSTHGDLDLDTTSKQRSRSFILVPINFSYTTSYRLSIVNFCSRTHRLATITSHTTDRQTDATL